MSDHDLKRYVVTFRYQERGLGDLQALNSAMVNGGYSTTLRCGRPSARAGHQQLWHCQCAGGAGAGGTRRRAGGSGA